MRVKDLIHSIIFILDDVFNTYSVIYKLFLIILKLFIIKLRL